MNILVLLALHHTKKDEKNLKLLRKSLKFENLNQSENQEKNITNLKSTKN